MSSISSIQVALFCLSISLGSCKKSAELIPSIHATTKKTQPLVLEHYQQAVIGTDENGNKVKGYINIEGDMGLGILTTTDAKEIEIIVEGANKHKLMGTDLEGIKYNLTVK